MTDAPPIHASVLRDGLTERSASADQRSAASARLFHKRARLVRLTQCYLDTGEHDAFARVAIDICLRSLDRQIRRMEQQARQSRRPVAPEASEY